jgi:germination protein M
MNKMKKQLAIIAIVLMALLLGACDKNSNDKEADNKSVVSVYYLDSKSSGLVSEDYELIGTEKEEQIEELLYMLKKGPENVVYKSALPENVTIKEFSFNEEDQLTINFETTYSELEGIPEVLCRAAIVKTVCQMEGVEYVVFNVNGQPLKEADKVVGFLTEEDFIDSTGTDTKTKVKLYFANGSGDELVEYETSINYTGIGTLEELVLQQLINGPTEIGMQSTIPEGTILLNVSTKEGICYVDFNEKFLEKLPDISDEIAIYSIVNTLVELQGINKVQFTINSEIVKTYREGTPFDVTFERNLDLIKGSK